MSDFRLNVIAETQAAEKKLQQVDKAANKAARPRGIKIDIKELSKNLDSLERNFSKTAKRVKQAYNISKFTPGLREHVLKAEEYAKVTVKTAKEQYKVGQSLTKSAQAAGILTNTLNAARRSGTTLLDTLAKIGLATFALKEAVGVVEAAWNGFFNNTIGREIRLRETILKTQTTLASTNKVFADGREITDPYKKIVTLTEAVADHIDSIRERSIALAGVTSNEVIEVFGIVASQVGQIGGGLKEAEDLAITFAAALGTFGIPLYQARQEIGSILRGDITLDSYLATALGIRNEDIAKARASTEGVVGFLEDRLAASVAGQKIAAEGFAGVVSNIADLGELIGQNFGRGLLDPLIAGLTNIFDTLFLIRRQIFDIAAGAGRAIGSAGRLVVGLTAGRTGLGVGNPEALARSTAAVAERGFQQIEQVAQRTVGALSRAIEALKPTALILGDAFKTLAEAFVRIKIGTFEALASALSNIATVVGSIAQPLATVFNLYARFLNTPAVRYFSEVAAVLSLLKRVGLDTVTQFALFGRFLVSTVIPTVGALGVALGGLIAVFAAVAVAVGKLILVLAGLATALVGPAAAIPALAAGLKALSVELASVGKQSLVSGVKLKKMSVAFRGAGAAAKAAGASILASLGWVFAIQVGLAALIDLFGRYQRAQEDQRSSKRATEALRSLQTTYKDVGDSADSATKSARDFKQAIVEANYSRNIDQLEEVSEKINQIRYELKPGIQSWNEFWSAISGAEIGRFEEQSRKTLGSLLKEEARIKAELSAVDAVRDRERANRDIKIQAQNRVNLEEEIKELKRRIESDLFQQRQAFAQKEVEIFRLAGEMRIKQIERANEKLIEGEEGASRAALEALDTYITTRERGELEIEAAKKTLAIEVANLEKSISDYQLDIAKKIAQIQKKSADYQRDSADARQRAAGGTTAAAPGVSSGFRVGSTGASTGPHLDIRSPTGNKQAVIDEATAIIKAWQGQGLEYIELSNAKIDVKNMFDEAELRKALVKEQTVHARRSGGGAIDIAVPAGTLVPVPAGTPSWGGAGGWQATSLQTGNLFLHGLDTSVASPTGAAAAAAAPPPAADAASDIPDATTAADNYAAAVRNLTGAMERYRALQEAVTSANTAEAFDRIAQSFFPRAQLEQYEDRLQEVRFTYDAIAASSAEAFNPERSAIEVTRLTALAAASRELEQVQTGIAAKTKAGQLNEAERVKAINAVNARYKQHINDLEKVAVLQRSILSTEQATALITQLRTQTRDIYRDIEALQLRNRREAESVAPEFIAAEIAKLDIQRQVERTTRELNDQLEAQIELRDRLQAQIAGAADADKAKLQKDLDAAREELGRLRKLLKAVPEAGAALAAAEDARARAATEPGTRIASFIGSAKRELKDLESAAIRVSQSIGDAIGSSISNGISGLIEGATTAEQVFSDFLKNIGQILVQEATKMIATYVAIGVARQFAGLFGFGAPSPTERGAFSIGQAATLALPSFDGGGFTGAGVRSGGLDGKGGFPAVLHPNEVVMPLERGDNSMQQTATAQLPFTRSAESLTPAQAMQAAGPIKVEYESTMINGATYVTEDQHRRGMAQAAERGRALTLDAIFNSPKVRRKAGL